MDSTPPPPPAEIGLTKVGIVKNLIFLACLCLTKVAERKLEGELAELPLVCFCVTWTTIKFNRNQLGTVSAFIMISVPWSNQRAHQVIRDKLLSKEFHGRTTDHK